VRRGWWLAALAAVGGCAGVGRAIEETIWKLTLLAGGLVAFYALLFTAICVVLLRKKKRTKVPLVLMSIAAIPVLGLGFWGGGYSLLEDLPLDRVAWVLFATSAALGVPLVLAGRLASEGRAPLVVTAVVAGVYWVMVLALVSFRQPGPRVPEGAIVEVALGPSCGCFRFAGGEVLCEGDWRLHGRHGRHSRPVRAPGADAVFVGADEACLLDGGDLWCWSDDDLPAHVDGDVRRAVHWRGARIVQQTDGRWRASTEGLPRRDGEPAASGVEVEDVVALLGEASAYDVSSAALCALSDELTCVGDVGFVPSLRGSVVAAGDDRACVLADDRLRCEEAPRRSSRGPFEVPIASPVEVDLGDRFGCARTRGGEVRCFGDPHFGHLGVPDTEPARWEDSVRTLEGASSLRVADDYACALVDGDAWCWGGVPFELDEDATRRDRRTHLGTALFGQHVFHERPARVVFD